jgi:metal-responsive CopG/Arc/MetJ family transcriptional regulator
MVRASSMHDSLIPYRVCRDGCSVRGMDKQHIPIYVPAPLVERIDAVASAEMRSRSNTTRWLLSQALEQREPVVDEPAEAG